MRRETNYIKVRMEIVVGFAGPAYLPTEFQHIFQFFSAGARELGMVDKPPGEIPVYMYGGRFNLALHYPKKTEVDAVSFEELKEIEAQVIKERAEVKAEEAALLAPKKVPRGTKRPVKVTTKKKKRRKSV